MSDDGRCGHCPVAAGEPCRHDVFPWFCDWAASGDAGKRLHVANRNALAKGDPAPPSFPPLLEQAGNLTRAVVQFVASGGKWTTPGERERRLAICHGCEHFAPGPPGRCRLCGCVANLAARVASKHCPDEPPRW